MKLSHFYRLLALEYFVKVVFIAMMFYWYLGWAKH